jgi:heat shock protein HslJ
MNCAHFASSCSLLDLWQAQSAPWNGQSTQAMITFTSDGMFTGTPTFSGYWNLSGANLAIMGTVGADMSCSYEDDWTVEFSLDCNIATLTQTASGCTGSRRYLDGAVTLTRPIR